MTHTDVQHFDCFDFHDPAETFANIPGILGYMPDEKVILLTASERGESLGPVLARAIDGLDSPVLLDATSDALQAERVTDVDIYFVSRKARSEECSYLMWLASVVQHWLDDREIRVRAVFAAEKIASGEEFVSLLNPREHGTMSEIESSWSTRRASRVGEEVSQSKLELEQRFSRRPESGDGGQERLIRSVLAECIAIVATQLHPSAESPPASLLCDATAQAGAVIAQIDEGALAVEDIAYDAEALHALILPLTHSTLRDMMFALCTSPLRATARAVWLEIARLTTDHVRANALVLYAVERFECGAEGAGHAALSAALECAQDHRLSQLIRTALIYDDATAVVAGMIRTSAQLVENAGELAIQNDEI